MAGNFTKGKKKYRDVEPKVIEIVDELTQSYEDLLAMTQEDTEAYGAVSSAYSMPKDSPEEKAARTAAIQEGLKVAMDVPLRTVRKCDRILALTRELVYIANPNLISDVGVAALHVQAALEGAKLNVEINLASLKDAELVASTQTEIDEAAERGVAVRDEVMKEVLTKIRG